MSRAFDWLSQAQNDLDAVRVMLSSSLFSQACFLAQQSAEKALKALAYFRGASIVKSHSVRLIAKDLGFNSNIEEAARELDIYYISARYPDGLPEGAPFQAFSEIQAKKALNAAEIIVDSVSNLMNKP